MHKSEAGTYQFDLKESVHLSHQQLPIEEIEDMELVPQVEIEEKGEEIDISGSLYLFGNYRGNLSAGKLDVTDEPADTYEESVQFEPLTADRGPFSPLAREDKFEYRIPVRISLPKGKVRDVSDVYAYISSFDYELKTPYQIDVIASLVIAGFVEQEERTEENLLSSEFEFIHVAGDNPVNQVEGVIEQRLKAIEEQIAGLEEQPELTESFTPFRNEDQDEIEETLGEQVEEVEPIDPFAQFRSENQEEIQPEAAAQVEEMDEGQPEEEVEEVYEEEPREEEVSEQAAEFDNVIPMPNLTVAEESLNQVEEEEVPEKELKVAISRKGTKQDREKITSLSSIFSNFSKADGQQGDDEYESADLEDGSNNEALYLTNFMGEKEEQFIKLKLCIIQKDETLEDIAERYRLQVETILRANQATRSQISAGQILYIPVKG